MKHRVEIVPTVPVYHISDCTPKEKQERGISSFRRSSDRSVRAEVPDGATATLEIRGTIYDIEVYRERPGHTPGALIAVEDIRIALSPEHPSETHGIVSFTYKEFSEDTT